MWTLLAAGVALVPEPGWADGSARRHGDTLAPPTVTLEAEPAKKPARTARGSAAQRLKLDLPHPVLAKAQPQKPLLPSGSADRAPEPGKPSRVTLKVHTKPDGQQITEAIVGVRMPM
jgi:hypothetical protein